MRQRRNPNIIVSNRSVLPYNLDNDFVRLKLTYRNGFQQSYTESISGHIYGNVGIGGSTVNLGSFITNKYGVYEFNYDTNTIPDRNINTAKFWASGIHDSWSLAINSNLARADFLFISPISGWIITAGKCIGDFSELGTRSTFDIFDGDREATSGVIFENYSGTVVSGIYANTYDIESQNTLYMSGNQVYYISDNYTISSDTILSFDYLGYSSGDIGGIGFEQSGDKIFNLYGSSGVFNGTSTISNYKYVGYDWKRIEIPIGLYYTGSFTELVFINSDTAPVGSHAKFRNVSLGIPNIFNDILVIERS